MNKFSITTLLAAGLSIGSAQAAVLAGYNFDQIASVVNPSATTLETGVLASNFGVGAGFTGYAGTNTDTFFVAEGQGLADGTTDDMAGAITANEYVTVTISSDVGYTLDLTNLTFDIGRSSRGANDFSIRSSIDGFATDLINPVATYNNQGITTTAAEKVVDLSGAAYDSLTSIEFRIYYDDRENNTNSASGTFIDNVALNGTAVAVPEPSSTALLGLGGLTLILRRRK